MITNNIQNYQVDKNNNQESIICAKVNNESNNLNTCANKIDIVNNNNNNNYYFSLERPIVRICNNLIKFMETLLKIQKPNRLNSFII